MNNALYNIKNGEYNCFCEEQPHNEQCECCDQQCCPYEPSESTELVQSDWNQTDSTLPDYIKHKPNIPDTSNYYNKNDVDGLLADKVDKLNGKGLSMNDYTDADKNKLGDLPTNALLTTALAGKQNTISDLETIRSGATAGATAVQPSDLATVATSGSYNDLSDKPIIPDISNCIQKSSTAGLVKNDGSVDTNTYLTQHQDISGKADKVSNATNGNFAALDSNGNLTDSGHKHSDYLTSHQDLSNYVQKSNTQGLLKNDGTVDTTQYTTNTGTITGITMNGQSKGTSGNVDLGTVITDVSGKEDITPIEAVASGTTAITAQVNKYYEVAGTVSSLTVTLPTPTVNTEVTMVVVHLTVGASPTVVVTSVNEVVKFSAAYSVVANKEYELSCLYNGSKWIVSSMEVAA